MASSPAREFSRPALLRMSLVAFALVLGACERTDPVAASASASAGAAQPENEVVVFAAASLKEPFGALAGAFERAHHVEVTFNFAGTQELRTQIEHGAPVDVFASADQKHMSELVRARKASGPALFARNEPVLVVSKELMGELAAFAELPRARRIVLGAPDVPIGRYSLQILDNASKTLGSDFRARVEARVVSRELNVRQVLAKVTLGEADAAIVYRTDAATAKGAVGVVGIPPELNVLAEYPIAVLEGAPHPRLARAWVALVLSVEGQAALAKAGFMLPVRSTTKP
jgi:molybdate transport system substrate-binding protein